MDDEQMTMDYGEARPMPEDATFDSASVSTVGELSVVAATRAAELKAELADAEKLSAFLVRLAEYMQKGWPTHVCALVDADSHLLKRMRAEGVSEVALLEAVYRQAKEQSRKSMAVFPRQMEQQAKGAGLPLNMEQSRHPDYYFNGRYFKVHVDDTKRLARLSTSEGDLGSPFPADVGAVLERVATEERRVFERKVVARPFMAALRKAYMTELKDSQASVGSAVPIRRVMKRLQRMNRTFRRDEFLADLGRLVKEGRTAIDGYAMDLQQIKSSSEGILLPGLEHRGYLGYIIFRRV